MPVGLERPLGNRPDVGKAAFQRYLNHLLEEYREQIERGEAKVVRIMERRGNRAPFVYYEIEFLNTSGVEGFLIWGAHRYLPSNMPRLAYDPTVPLASMTPRRKATKKRPSASAEPAQGGEHSRSESVALEAPDNGMDALELQAKVEPEDSALSHHDTPAAQESASNAAGSPQLETIRHNKVRRSNADDMEDDQSESGSVTPRASSSRPPRPSLLHAMETRLRSASRYPESEAGVSDTASEFGYASSEVSSTSTSTIRASASAPRRSARLDKAIHQLKSDIGDFNLQRTPMSSVVGDAADVGAALDYDFDSQGDVNMDDYASQLSQLSVAA